MKKSAAAVSAIVALSLLSANVAFGQGRGDRGDRGDRRDERAQNHNVNRHDNGRHNGWSNNRNDVPREYHRWNRGDRLPSQYRDRQYVVNDWRGHHLNAPPRGYQWVQSGSDYLLVAIATGLIAQLLSQ